tara:strand:+ start:1776 stop:1937 length:162 start_codon:yes stop_codon:yes gene_type:complete
VQLHGFSEPELSEEALERRVSQQGLKEQRPRTPRSEYERPRYGVKLPIFLMNE